MATAIGSLLRSGRPQQSLNILSASTHERYQSNFGLMNHTFYLYAGGNIKEWNSVYAPLPANHILLNGELGFDQIPKEIDFDLVLIQNKFGQFQILSQIAKALCLPILVIEHTLPMPDWPPEYIANVKKMKGTVNAFISEYSREKWGWSESEADVVHHGIDSDKFAYANNEQGKDSVVLSVVNDWINRDLPCGFSLWKETSKGLPVRVVGDTPGLSKPAASLEELVKVYQTSQVFLNTSQVSPIPSVLLEAMSCGCSCVSTPTCMIPEIIKHGENGLLGETPEELRYYCKELLNNAELRQKLARGARKTIEDRFSKQAFLSRWELLFRKTIMEGYRYNP
jgi:glycosyltransferase involved in cell wall biosynthesis